MKWGNLKKIAIPTSEGLCFINVDDIVYLEASANYTKFYLTNKSRHLVIKTVKDFEEVLPHDIFIRIHNSYTINKQYGENTFGDGG